MHFLMAKIYSFLLFPEMCASNRRYRGTKILIWAQAPELPHSLCSPLFGTSMEICKTFLGVEVYLFKKALSDCTITIILDLSKDTRL